MKKGAVKWYDQLPDKTDWDKIKTAFLEKYKEDDAAARAFTRISQIKMKKHGSVRKYADRLLDLVDKYNPNTTKSTIRDWFINGLPSHIGRYVRREGGDTFEEAQEATQKYVDSELSGKSVSKRI